MFHRFDEFRESNVHLYLLAAGLLMAGAVLSETISAQLLAADGPLTLSTVSASVGGVLRRRRGRPRKFSVPSRAVTLTLPEAVIAALTRIDRDLSRAIVRIANLRAPKNGHPAAELSVFGRRAVITVEPNAALASRIGIELVPLPDGRALIAFDHPMSNSQVELLLDDSLEDAGLPDQERRLFESVRDILRDARRSEDVTLLQRSIIILEGSKRTGRNGSAAARPAKTR